MTKPVRIDASALRRAGEQMAKDSAAKARLAEYVARRDFANWDEAYQRQRHIYCCGKDPPMGPGEVRSNLGLTAGSL